MRGDMGHPCRKAPVNPVRGARPRGMPRPVRQPVEALGLAILLGVAGLAAPAALDAQQSPPGRPAAQLQDRPQPRMVDRQAMMARVQRDYERHMVRELGLTGDQLGALRSVIAEFHPPRAAIMRERRELAVALRGLGQASGGEARARELLDRSRALRSRELDLQRQEEERLLEFLSPTQVLQLHQVREAFAERIRRLEGSPQMRRGGPPGGGFSPPDTMPDPGR
jgi:hypothetical protein